MMPALAMAREKTIDETIATKDSTKCDKCGQNLSDRACRCIVRGVFQACLRKWEECKTRQMHTGTSITVESPSLVSRRTEEYIADFELVCRRGLEPFELMLFKRALRGRVGRDESTKILELKLGQRILEMKPYSLYPTIDYFGRPVLTVLSTRKQGPNKPGTSLRDRAIIFKSFNWSQLERQ